MQSEGDNVLEYSKDWWLNGEPGADAGGGRTTGMSVVSDILAEPRAVVLYEREDEQAVREMMHSLVDEMAAQMVDADPLLSNLVVIDNETQIEKWPGWIDITTPSEVDANTLHRSQNVVILSPGFLRQKESLPLILPGRLYAMTPNLAVAASLGIDTIIHLESAA